jgi:hypothetical protein
LFEGTYKHGKKEGLGKFSWSDGAVYEGEFRANNIDGYGKYTWPDNKFYQGYW